MENGNVKIVKLVGGLGNQLFQYAFGQYLQERFNCKVKYFNEPGTSQLWALEQLVPNIAYCSKEDLSACHYAFSSRLRYRVKRKLCEILPWLNKTILLEIGSQYHEHISSNTKVFDGYWQSYKYLNPADNFVTQPSVISLPLLQEIGSCNAVFVHLRRGDYLSNKNKGLFAICPICYFEQAIKQLQKELTNPIFYIFSNDTEWAKTHLNIENAQLQYVTTDSPHADVIEFLEMTHCQHAIISNSTFSWWAAWLIENKEKKVIAPAQWYLKPQMNEQTNDLIPPSWTRI